MQWQKNMRLIDANVERTEKTVDTSKSMAGFQVLQSFAGTLPADFDYKKELEEMRDEKYRRLRAVYKTPPLAGRNH